jgi:hypothetical protein
MAASRPNCDPTTGLVIYAPPDQNRTLILDDGRTWNSSEEGVVFFETGRYGDYTSGAWIRKLLDVLIGATAVSQMGLRIDAGKIKKIPEWLHEARDSRRVLTGRFGIGDLDRFIQFFHATGSYGVWDCYGLSPQLEPTTVFEPLPDAFHHCERYPFVVEVDLDSVLLGYARPQKGVQELVLALSEIGKGDGRKDPHITIKDCGPL